MFTSISRQQYITFLVIALLIYYALIGFLYFRAEIGGIFNRDKVRTISFLHLSSHEAPADETDNSMLFPSVHELMDDLKSVISKNSHKQINKEELVLSLKDKVNRYPQLKDTAFTVAINNFLQQELPQLEETDLNRLWK